MKVLSDPILFEWDKGNIDKNLKRHVVTNKEAEEVFKNEPLLISEDVKHSMLERRYQALGKTDKNRLLFLSFTVRHDHVRIISIRDMSRRERRSYEKEKIQTDSSL